MPTKYNVRHPGVRVWCGNEWGWSSSLLVWISWWSPGLIRIETPTVFHRTVWTVDQAVELRDVLTTAVRVGGESR
ncbi:hypothetical protein SAMN04487904_1103 [Actinopolyspora lacussalsi subsp. righensis]|uniref:Uncharacterized protein n=1 Tax=Actinopolyspora righensis TaxID=995060 RepID=A0A1I7B891_9ACTN|nr:hypothetical protein SAMN04487904_1103 [Actinopolyspora righensis]